MELFASYCNKKWVLDSSAYFQATSDRYLFIDLYEKQRLVQEITIGNKVKLDFWGTRFIDFKNGSIKNVLLVKKLGQS